MRNLWGSWTFLSWLDFIPVIYPLPTFCKLVPCIPRNIEKPLLWLFSIRFDEEDQRQIVFLGIASYDMLNVDTCMNTTTCKCYTTIVYVAKVSSTFSHKLALCFLAHMLIFLVFWCHELLTIFSTKISRLKKFETEFFFKRVQKGGMCHFKTNLIFKH